MDLCCHRRDRVDVFECSYGFLSFALFSSRKLQQPPGLSFLPSPWSWRWFLPRDQETVIVAVTHGLTYSLPSSLPHSLSSPPPSSLASVALPVHPPRYHPSILPPILYPSPSTYPSPTHPFTCLPAPLSPPSPIFPLSSIIIHLLTCPFIHPSP